MSGLQSLHLDFGRRRTGHRAQSGIHLRRFASACAIVLLLLICLPVSDHIAKALCSRSETAPDVASGRLGGGISPEAYAADPFGALDAWDEHLRAPAVQLPTPFAEELGVPPDAYDIRYSDGAAAMDVVGYSIELDSGSELREVEARMGLKGWSCVPLGGGCGATFVKDEGVYRWALITCSQVGGSTSVVVRAMRS